MFNVGRVGMRWELNNLLECGFGQEDPDEVEYYRKRQQHISVSTIDTSSPARVTPGGLPNYCTLRNGGIPLQDLNNIGTHIGTRPNFMVSEFHFIRCSELDCD